MRRHGCHARSALSRCGQFPPAYAAILAELAPLNWRAFALDESCCGIHWDVLDWNAKAIELYPALLTDEALLRLAENTLWTKVCEGQEKEQRRRD